MRQQVGWGSTVKCPCKITPLSDEQLKSLLRAGDKNGDGRLSREELKEIFRLLGALIPDWRALRALVHADENGDGHISQAELQQLVAYVRQQNYKNPGCHRHRII